MRIVLDEGAKVNRAHPTDAGLDLFSRNRRTIDGYGFATFDTGVHVQIPEGFYGEIRSRSSLMIKGITTDGTIDSHYTGPLKVCLFNHGITPYVVEAGDKIAQLVIVPCMLPELTVVDSLEETDRGDAGFGSTGR